MNPVPSTEPYIDEAESSGTYNKEVLFDKKTYQKIVSKSLKMDSHEGFKRGFLTFLSVQTSNILVPTSWSNPYADISLPAK